MEGVGGGDPADISEEKKNNLLVKNTRINVDKKFAVLREFQILKKIKRWLNIAFMFLAGSNIKLNREKKWIHKCDNVAYHKQN